MLLIYEVYPKGYMIGYLISDEGIFHASTVVIVKVDVIVSRSVTATPEC